MPRLKTISRKGDAKHSNIIRGTEDRPQIRKRTAMSPVGLRETAVIAISSLLLSVSLLAQQAPPPPTNVTGDPTSLLLPVAHSHFGSWCMGYLTITPEGVRYEPVGSQGRNGHSFQLNRSDVTYLNYWMIAGQLINAVEIRTARAVYHFWLLQSPADALSVRQPSWKPVEAAPADSLLVSLRFWSFTGRVPNLASVNLAIAQARATLARNNNNDNNSSFDQAARKMSDHMFVNGYGSTVTTNTINTINHMSHW
jgi:hypothetical protein